MQAADLGVHPRPHEALERVGGGPCYCGVRVVSHRGHRRICLHRSWRARPVLVGRRQLWRVLAVPLCLPPRQESGHGVIQVVELLGVRPEKLACRHLDDIEA